jgi:hypothetical protein
MASLYEYFNFVAASLASLIIFSQFKSAPPAPCSGGILEVGLVSAVDGVDEGFEIEYEGFTAFVSYKAEIREDAGDYWTAPSWTIEKESTTVAAVWDEQGNEYPEIAEALQVLLN